MHSFSSRVVIITGGGAGIGRAAALKFATQGDQVIVTGRRPDPLHALAEEHRNIGFVIADAGNPEDAARTVREVTGIKSDETARIPLGRRGRPDDVAEWITSLASSGAVWLTGQVITADGGLSVA